VLQRDKLDGKDNKIQQFSIDKDGGINVYFLPVGRLPVE
jgi:hypothetical protein